MMSEAAWARDDIAALRGLAAQRGLGIDRPASARRGVVIVDPKTGAKICKPDGSSVFSPEHAKRYLSALPDKRWLALE